MRRRIFLYVLCGALSAPRVALAQQTIRPKRVAILTLLQRNADSVIAIVDGLRSLGFEEGNNLIIDELGIGRRAEELESVASQIAQSNVDAIVAASGGLAVAAAQAASRTIPIIGIADDMVLAGYVRSLANHGGNTTGISILAADLDIKRLDILTELLPKARHIAILSDSNIQSRARLDQLEAAALIRQIKLSVHPVGKSGEIPAAIEAAQGAGAEALNIVASPLFNANRQAIFAKARSFRLPTIFQWPEGTRDGALLAYGPSQLETLRQMGRMTGKILAGTAPANIPVEQPTKFYLAVNLQLAREFGLTVPATLLARADEVIE